MEALPQAKKLAKHCNVIAYLKSEHLWVRKGVLKHLQNVGGACNELCTCDCTCGVRMDVVVTLGMRWDSIVCLGRAIRCGYDTERYRVSQLMPALNAFLKKKSIIGYFSSIICLFANRHCWKPETTIATCEICAFPSQVLSLATFLFFVC